MENCNVTKPVKWRRVKKFSQRHYRELHVLCSQEWWCAERTLEDIARSVKASDRFIAFADKKSGQLIAFARVLSDGVFKAFIFDVIVDARYRGAGLGQQLLATILEEYAGVHHVELYCRHDMIPFYQRCGFTAEIPGVALMRRTQGANVSLNVRNVFQYSGAR